MARQESRLVRPQPPLPRDYSTALQRLARSGDKQRLNASLRAADEARWTRRRLGEALGVTGESVRLRCLSAADQPHPDPLVPPPAPTYAEKPPPPPRPTLSKAEIAQLRKLHAVSRQLRGNAPLDSPKRQAARELAALLVAYKERGLRWEDLSDALGSSLKTPKNIVRVHGHQ